MYKILIPGLADFENRGGMAILLGLISCLRGNLGEVDITLLSRHPEAHKKYECFGIKIEQYPWLRKSTGLKGLLIYAILMPFDLLSCWFMRIVGKFFKRVKYRYDKYDIAIPIIVDGLSDDDHGSNHVIQALVQELFSQLVIAKPRAIIPTDLGPFNSVFTKRLAKIVFNRVELLALRENTSYKCAMTLGLNKPQIRLSADMAFLMSSISREQAIHLLGEEGIIINEKPLVGLSPSLDQQIACKFPDIDGVKFKQEKYIDILATIIDYMVEKLNAVVCIIPHVYPADKELSKKIYGKVINKQNVVMLQNDYLANELKGVIGLCDMFIGGRMHTTIASTSMGIPTIAIATKDKFRRLIGETMGQSQFVLDILNLDSNKMINLLETTVDILWEKRLEVRKELQTKIKLSYDRAFSFGAEIKNIIS